MDQHAPSTADGPATTLARWLATLPPPPFIDSAAGPGNHRFVPLSPRVAVLVRRLSPGQPEALAASLRSIGIGPTDV